MPPWGRGCVKTQRETRPKIIDLSECDVFNSFELGEVKGPLKSSKLKPPSRFHTASVESATRTFSRVDIGKHAVLVGAEWLKWPTTSHTRNISDCLLLVIRQPSHRKGAAFKPYAAFHNPKRTELHHLPALSILAAPRSRHAYFLSVS